METKIIKNRILVSTLLFIVIFTSCNKKLYYDSSTIKYIVMYTSYQHTEKSNIIEYRGIIIDHKDKMFLATMSKEKEINILEQIKFDSNITYNLQINNDSLNKRKIMIDDKGTVESIQINDCYFEEIIIYNNEKLYKYASYCTDKLQNFVYTTDRHKFIDLRNSILNYYTSGVE